VECLFSYPASLGQSRRRVEAIHRNRRFESRKRGQLFIRTHNETLSVAAMRVSNERSMNQL
jgi:hypothetical protein